MNVLPSLVLIVTIFFVAFGVFIFFGILWKILTRRDQLYSQRYEDFLERQERVRRKIDGN